MSELSKREQFLLDRKTGIGGSDIAAIMGLSPWKSAFDVYMDKVSTECENLETPAMSRGRKLEKYILEEYSEHTGEELETDLPMIRDKDYPFLIGNYDAKVKGKNVLVEAKSVGSNSSSWGDVIPVYYRTQVAHYAAISDCDYIDVPVLFDRWQYAQYTYYRDQDYENTLKNAAIDFWTNHVLKRIPPEPKNIEDIKKLYPKAQVSVLKANIDIKNALIELNRLELEKKNLEGRTNTIKAYIMQNMGDNEIIEDDSGKSLVIWRNSTRKLFDSAAFKEKHSELYNEYTKNVECRTFRIT